MYINVPHMHASLARDITDYWLWLKKGKLNSLNKDVTLFHHNHATFQHCKQFEKPLLDLCPFIFKAK